MAKSAKPKPVAKGTAHPSMKSNQFAKGGGRKGK